MLGIQSNNLNFEVLQVRDPRYLAILNLSEYMDNPKQPHLRIVLPGYVEPVFLPISKEGVTTYNSNSLQPRPNTLDLYDLPDGVYKISYHIYPHDEEYVVKYHLKTSLFERSYAQFMLSLEVSDCSMKQDTRIKLDIFEIDLFIETARAHIEEGNIKSGNEFYRKAGDLLSKLNRKLKGCN